MSRSVAWRKTCNELVFWRQCQALNATIYILRETGPTGFLLKEEGEAKPVKAYLGDPHKCTCTQFQKDRDLCRHLCWLILKKFRVTQNNPISWQLGLVDRELNEVLHGQANKQPPKPPVRRWASSGPSTSVNESRTTIRQKDITEDDCCPICQDELLGKHIPVTYCKFGCGNSIHIKCMKVYAEHQKTTGDSVIKCPFCREDFGPLELLKQESRNAMGVQPGGRMDRHLGISCQSCHLGPIDGKCYRCSICADYYLCQSCFNTQIHTNHPFDYRHKRNQRWRPAQRTYGAMLPQAVADNLVNREITEADFELLMQLDNNATGSDIPEDVINSFPLEKVRDNSNLLQPGMQCRICLRGYELGQYIRKLPRCKHKFHKDCIDNWLLHSHATCPADGLVVWDPVTAQQEQEEKKNSKSLKSRKEDENANPQEDLSLILPGVGIIRQDRTNEGRTTSSKGPRRPPVRPQRLAEGSNGADVGNIGAGFALDVRSVGPRTNENETEATSSNHLPGNRLLNRTQSQRQMLHNHKSSFGSQPGAYLSGQDIDSGELTARSGTDSVSQSETISELPLGHKNTKHSSIFGHLSMLSDENRPDSNRSTQSTPQRSRNSMKSCNEMRSPFGRDLPPLLESDLENVPGIDNVSDVKKGSYHNSQKNQFFQKLPRLQLPLDNDIPNRTNSVELTSIRSTPDSRSQSQRSLQTLRITPRTSAVPDSTNEVRNVSAQSEIIRRVPRKRPDENGRWSQAESDISGPGSGQSEPVPMNETLSERLQEVQMATKEELLDLYLGNNPRDQPAVNRVVNIPTRPARRALGGAGRRRPAVRRVRSNEFGLDGNALANITLRDMI